MRQETKSDPIIAEVESKGSTHLFADIALRFQKKNYPLPFPSEAALQATFSNLSVEDLGFVTLTSKSSQESVKKYLRKENQKLQTLTQLAALTARLNELRETRNSLETDIQQEMKKHPEGLRQCSKFTVSGIVCTFLLVVVFVALGLSYRKNSNDKAESKSDSLDHYLSTCSGVSPKLAQNNWKMLTGCNPLYRSICDVFVDPYFGCNLATCLTSMANFCNIGDPLSYREDGYFWAAGAFALLGLSMFCIYKTLSCINVRDAILASPFSRLTNSRPIAEKLLSDQNDQKNDAKIKDVLRPVETKISHLEKNITKLKESPEIKAILDFLNSKNKRNANELVIDIKNPNSENDSMTAPLLLSAFIGI